MDDFIVLLIYGVLKSVVFVFVIIVGYDLLYDEGEIYVIKLK